MIISNSYGQLSPKLWGGALSDIFKMTKPFPDLNLLPGVFRQYSGIKAVYLFGIAVVMNTSEKRFVTCFRHMHFLKNMASQR